MSGSGLPRRDAGSAESTSPPRSRSIEWSGGREIQTGLQSRRASSYIYRLVGAVGAGGGTGERERAPLRGSLGRYTWSVRSVCGFQQRGETRVECLLPFPLYPRPPFFCFLYSGRASRVAGVWVNPGFLSRFMCGLRMEGCTQGERTDIKFPTCKRKPDRDGWLGVEWRASS